MKKNLNKKKLYLILTFILLTFTSLGILNNELYKINLKIEAIYSEAEKKMEINSKRFKVSSTKSESKDDLFIELMPMH